MKSRQIKRQVCSRSQNGFTFIEVIVCLAIVGIGISATLQSVNNFYEMRRVAVIRNETAGLFQSVKQNFLSLSSGSLPTTSVSYYVDQNGNFSSSATKYSVQINPNSVSGLSGLKSYEFYLTNNDPKHSLTMHFEVIR